MTAPSADSARPARLRADIQALRAIAVVAVLVFHLWPAGLSGGYVGVDVFFVISGFLIGTQLLREIEASGRLDLPAFWARRIRRLQPSALLVLFATLAGILAWAPRALWVGWLEEIAASALWVQNWLLGANAVDYLAAGNAPSPVQHYWTLSVEEQFYLGFPLLLGASAWLARRRGIAPARLAPACLLAVAGASLLCSLWQTHASPSMAYFSTFARAWEFAAGALLASTRATAPANMRTPAVALGLALIVASARIFGSETRFPGIAALAPVAGALLCLWAGRGSALETFGRLRPVAAMGDCSYAIYLWHWPLIVLAPWVPLQLPSGPGGSVRMLALAACSLLLGWLTTRLVEDPIRFAPRLASESRLRRRVAAGFVAGLALLVASVSFPLQAERGRQQAIDRNLARIRALPIERLPPCFGAAAAAVENRGCRNPALDGVLLPDLALVRNDDASRTECWNKADGEFRLCTIGPASGYSRRILAVGDSHIVTLLDAYRYIAGRNNWRIDVSAYRSCYLSTAPPGMVLQRGCRNWRDFIAGQARKHRYDAYLVTHSRSSSRVAPVAGKTPAQAEVDGLVDAWRGLPAAPILVLADNPGTGRGSRIVSCYLREAARGGDIRTACSWKRRDALPADGLRLAADRVDGARVVDLTDFYCDESTCPAVIGNVLVYRDDNHVTRTWARTLAPYLERRLVAALVDAERAGAAGTGR